MTKILFIGGTGVISSACSRLAMEQGMQLFHLNRGKSQNLRDLPEIPTLQADIKDRQALEMALGNHQFDVVVNWIAFTPDQIEQDLEVFRGRTRQYVFISSASAYQTPPAALPVTESTPLDNRFWQYSQDKIACEEKVKAFYEIHQIPFTIVRPSHTYDKTLLPLVGGYTTLHRMLTDQPVIVPGDGTSIWTLTHHRDFATGFVGLLGNKNAYNEVFQITSDEWLTWNQIYRELAAAFGVSPRLISVPSDWIAKFLPEKGPGILGDKMHSMIFDNSKIKSVVPEFDAQISFKEGAGEIADWYKNNLHRYKPDPDLNAGMDQLVEKFLIN